jgi:hypothetical protein
MYIHFTDSSDARPISIWPFASHITSLTYDSKHEHLAVALQSGNVCIIERTIGNKNTSIRLSNEFHFISPRF